MDKLISSGLSAIVAVGITAAAMTYFDAKKIPQPKQIVSSELLRQATPQCQAFVQETAPNPDCRLVEVYDGSKCVRDVMGKDKDGKDVIVTPASCEKITGWMCDGAFQPVRVQDCLLDAVKKLPVVDIEEPK